MKGVFWDVMLCGSCKNQCFGGTYDSIIRVTRIGELGATLAITTSVLTRATQRNIPEDDILHSHRRENLKSYKVIVFIF
jgi:hypothetical protein